MFKLLFSANIDLDIFKNKDKLKNIKQFDSFKIYSIVIDQIGNRIFINIYGKSKLYKRKLKDSIEYKDYIINDIKNKIEDIIDKEIENVNSDLEFLSIIIPKLNECRKTLSKDKILSQYKNDIKRFIDITEHTYIELAYKSDNGLYSYLIFKNYYM